MKQLLTITKTPEKLCPSQAGVDVTDLWRFEGVICGKVYGQEKHSALVRTVIL